MPRWSSLTLVVASVVAGTACDGGSEPPPGNRPPPDDAATPTGTPELPPQGQVALEAWLQAGHHLGWTCEQAISPPRMNGAHGRHRICTNQALLDSVDVPYPVGAASVKELYDRMDRPNGFAVGVKIAPGKGPATWYWYERIGTSPTSRPVADGVGVKICGPDCHAAAPRDNVYLRAQ